MVVRVGGFSFLSFLLSSFFKIEVGLGKSFQCKMFLERVWNILEWLRFSVLLFSPLWTIVWYVFV